MQGDPDGSFSHGQLARGLADRRPLNRDRAHHVALAGRQAVEVAVHVARRRGRTILLRGQNVGKILDRHIHAAALSTQGVDQLVARDRPDPGTDWVGLDPGVPLQVNGQQRFLHDILGIALGRACAGKPSTRRRPQDRGKGLQLPPVGHRVAGIGRPHQAGPFDLALVHARSLHQFA